MFSKEIEILTELKNSQKFSEREFNKRGLNPSCDDIIETMENNIDECLSELIENLHSSKNKNSLKKTLRNNLKKIGENLDTEEKELIADNYSKIAITLGIDFKNDLNTWLYGSFFTMMKKMTEIIKGKEKIIETIENVCSNCGSKLDTFIIEKMDSTIQNDYNIVRCQSCSEYNLIDNGSGNKRIQFGNYELVEQLPKNNYNFEEANIRLKQIKTFRK